MLYSMGHNQTVEVKSIVNIIVILSIICALLLSAGRFYAMVMTTQKEFFYLTIDGTTRLISFITAFICWVVTFLWAFISVLRLLTQRKINLRLYCDLCAMVAISWTVEIFTIEIAYRNHYVINTDNASIFQGLIFLAVCYGFIFLSKKVK